MPWRKKWIDPEEYEDKEELGRVLSKRAYEVWVSEVSEYIIFFVVEFLHWTRERGVTCSVRNRVSGGLRNRWLTIV